MFFGFHQYIAPRSPTWDTICIKFVLLSVISIDLFYPVQTIVTLTPDMEQSRIGTIFSRVFMSVEWSLCRYLVRFISTRWPQFYRMDLVVNHSSDEVSLYSTWLIRQIAHVTHICKSMNGSFSLVRRRMTQRGTGISGAPQSLTQLVTRFLRTTGDPFFKVNDLFRCWFSCVSYWA